ncbi:MAG TPA: carbamoyltransferase C-terminal domain-containing protein [Chitinophaga sp.]|uniref:carbamoyltransferase family protein n=1 Tax=Chitinophaga sp. TaxID=1869181 RepID=UPI002F92A21C
MVILGFNGSVAGISENRFNLDFDTMHDAGATLIEDGRIICTFEEERLNRIKHTNKFPVRAIEACLEEHNIDLDDIDAFAFPNEEAVYDQEIIRYGTIDPSFNYGSARAYLVAYFQQYFNRQIDPARIFFVNHHLAHAASTYYVSGFNKSLILALDGWGDNFSGGIYEGEGNEIRTIQKMSHNNSLGNFYVEVTRLLGFEFFDEYKVMGLAPYGDKDTYKHIFDELYELQPEGAYHLHRDRLRAIGEKLPSRRKGEPVTQVHKDIAAALQAALEEIVLHLVKHYQSVTVHDHLCLSGGVSLNCTMTGRLLYENIFRDVFVQPASNDTGLPLGAALYTYYQAQPHAERYTFKHAYLGNKAPETTALVSTLEKWKDVIEYYEADEITHETARLIAAGNVIGWFQGSSEFGPRALGNRSILADPRPAGNKDLINRKIKNREGFRPFAPSLTEESVARFFELPDHRQDRYGFMTFILKVKEEYRSRLGAITHVDGTARLQTVTRETNARYYELINSFGELTGMPVLLNTSFNNNCEPIVDTPQQAINCFLTTHLDYLVIGNFIIRKREQQPAAFYLSLYPLVPAYTRLHVLHENGKIRYEIGNTFNERKHPLSRNMYALLKSSDGSLQLGKLIAGLPDAGPEDAAAIIEEMQTLWTLRTIELTAGAAMNLAIG